MSKQDPVQLYICQVSLSLFHFYTVLDCYTTSCAATYAAVLGDATTISASNIYPFAQVITFLWLKLLHIILSCLGIFFNLF